MRFLREFDFLFTQWTSNSTWYTVGTLWVVTINVISIINGKTGLCYGNMLHFWSSAVHILFAYLCTTKQTFKTLLLINPTFCFIENIESLFLYNFLQFKRMIYLIVERRIIHLHLDIHLDNISTPLPRLCSSVICLLYFLCIYTFCSCTLLT